jgi:type VI secretion system protein ImpK
MATSPQPPAASFETFENLKRGDNMALIFQEVLTVIARLRAGRQLVTDAEVFRRQMHSAFKKAETEGTQRGYVIEDMRVGQFAVVALLDESILKSQNPVFADWPRQPMQNEMFGVFVAGEIFFKNLERLLGRADSEPLADLLEVHQLCLLLGFRGRFSSSGTTGEIRMYITQIEEKIRRIRGTATPLSWQPPVQVMPATGDRWIPKLRLGAIACVVLALLLFVFYQVSLSSKVGDLNKLADGMGQAGSR